MPSYDLAVTATDGAQVATTVVHIDVLDANGERTAADLTGGDWRIGGMRDWEGREAGWIGLGRVG